MGFLLLIRYLDMTQIKIIFYFLVAESWERHPIGILAGNKYHFGIYDECVNVQNPVTGQYCLSEITLISSTGKDFSFNRTEDLDDFGNNDAWRTVLGVRINSIFEYFSINKNNKKMNYCYTYTHWNKFTVKKYCEGCLKDLVLKGVKLLKIRWLPKLFKINNT